MATTTTVAFERMVNFCCSEGIQWAEAEKTCNKINSVSEPIPLELMSVCLGTAEICCTRQYRSLECVNGMSAAKTGNTCNRDPELLKDVAESDYYKDCCEACKIGLVMSATVDQCGLKSFTFGSPWDEVYQSCCSELFDASVEQGSFTLNDNEESGLK